MKKIFGLLLTGILLLNSFGVKAQSYAESALLYSRLLPQGSARIQGLGGAQVSLGGDYSSAGSNPAGLGMFNKSEFSFSPGMNLSSSTSKFLYDQTTNTSTSSGASKGTFEIPGISMVIHKKYGQYDDETPALIGGSFGITISRTNDFNRSFSYQGDNPTSSIVDYFVQNASANGDISQFNPPDPNTGVSGYNYGYPPFLAYDSYLIDSTSNPNKGKGGYYSVLSTDPSNQADKRTVHQREDVNIKGGQNQANIAYGVNFMDKFFFGGGIGIAFMHYNSLKTFSESNYRFDINPNNFNPVNQVVLSESLKSSGVGFNANLGVIARPVDFIQIGLSYNSPTIYSLSDTYQAALTTDYNNFDIAYYGYASNVLNGVGTDTGTPVASQSYSLKTPSRINLGATVFILKQGFITADVEKVNYPGAKYSTGSSGIDFSSDNTEIKSSFQSTYNFRGGAEYRYKNYRVRGGYSFMPSPYPSTFKTSANAYSDLTSVSGGLGYKASKFYIDLAVISRSTNAGYTPYSVQNYNTLANTSPRVTSKFSSTMIMVTVGFTIKR